jgi:universal stress protein E
MQILAATDFSARSDRALRKAGLLAQAMGAELTVLHVVDDDQPQDVIENESREAERVLAGQVRATTEMSAARSRPMVVAGIPSTGFCVALRRSGQTSL